MISFNLYNRNCRLGNNMFQYAFTRTQAELIGVQFFFPNWIGDDIFDFDDRTNTVMKPSSNIQYYYREIWPTKDYNRA